MSKKYTDRQTDKITRTNERIRVLRPKLRILKVLFPFPFSVFRVRVRVRFPFSVSVSVSVSVSGSVSVGQGIAPYGIRKSYDFEI